MENKTTSPYCKLFTRFLKEHGFFNAWKENARSYYRSSNMGFSVAVKQRRYLETVWKRCNSEYDNAQFSLRLMKIYSIIDLSLYWDETQEGRRVWESLDTRWRELCDGFEYSTPLFNTDKERFKDVFSRYATERIINNLTKFT